MRWLEAEMGIYPAYRLCKSEHAGYNSGVWVVLEKEAEVEEVVAALRAGEIVVLPTETVYITAVDATNPEAVRKLCEYKNRPLGKPFSVAVVDQKMAEEYVELNETAKKLYRTFLPGPVTVVSRGRHKTAPGVESETGTLGIRIPDYKIVLDVVRALGKPITATSANASYQRRPYKLTDIWENISQKQRGLISRAVDAGELPHNEPSTVIDTTMDDIVTLRQGDVVLGTKCEVLSRGEENTMNVGKELWQKYEGLAGQRAVVFALEGKMGAGKTVFVKGLARAMGIQDEVVSPTFILNDQYASSKSQIKLEHVDVWRMQSPEELEQLGLAGMIHDKCVVAIEWADRVAEVVRKYSEEAVVVWVKIEYGKKENERIISWTAI